MAELSKSDKAFIAAIAHNWPDYIIAVGASRLECCVPSYARDTCGVCSGDGCDDCADTGVELLENISDELLQLFDEASFSWAECDSCGSRLGGNRHNAHAIHHEAFGPDAKRPDDIHHIDICTDCVMFHANGDLPEQWADLICS